MVYEEKIASINNIKPYQAAETIKLLDEGNTIPFIARYRKEMTGSLDEEQIRQVSDQLEHLRALDERKATVVTSIEEQGKMTQELREMIALADRLTDLEDLYAPFKPKRRTRATIAREKGLQGLADLILQQPISRKSVEAYAKEYINENAGNIDDVLSGARDIVAEVICDHTTVRSQVRAKALQWGLLETERMEDSVDDRRVFELYYQYQCRIERMKPHQVLALNRGEKEKVLRIRFSMPGRDWEGIMTAIFRPNMQSPFFEQLRLAMEDSAVRLLLPAIERDIRRHLTGVAEQHAIRLFAENLKALLYQPPLADLTVIGIDPGFRSGCKLAVMDPTGKVLATGTIYPHEPQKKWTEALATLQKLVEHHRVTLLSIGNGTASRETEQLAAELIKNSPGLRYMIVNEAGASVYSASPLARSEMPDLDVTLRGAVSIGRRVQDPLAELVKIDPKSIGVGLYQHDVDQAQLESTLRGVVESVVNRVGVDANTASPALLTYVAGIGPKLAKKIVLHRNDNGPFRNRQELRNVQGLGPKAFEQAAGFLRIRGGDETLDMSAIHPESYPAAARIIQLGGFQLKETNAPQRKHALDALVHTHPMEKLANELKVGVPTLWDIIEQLVGPGRDPRQDAPSPILRSDVLKMDDLVVGMKMKGTVRNMVDFGAFVDIGVKQDGLLHRSQIPSGTELSVGDVIDLEIIKVEMDRNRISLRYIPADPA